MLLTKNSFFKSLKKVGLWTGLSRIFGLIRDISTTSLLGASVFHDIFVVTLKIPNLFRRFFAEGAFNQAFIPVYSDFYRANDEKATKEFLNALAGSFLSILFLITIIVLLITPIFILIFAPGFYFDDFGYTRGSVPDAGHLQSAAASLHRQLEQILEWLRSLLFPTVQLVRFVTNMLLQSLRLHSGASKLGCAS